jgi:deazaflavin-dependent oxidoreductase (nitroreductase family)
MPIPRRVGQWNKVGLNRLTRHIAPWLPGLGVVVHRGRRSGRRYRTPVNVFPARDGYLIALTYGPGTDWVKNVMAAGGCELETRGAPSGWSHRACIATRPGAASAPANGRSCGPSALPTSWPSRPRPREARAPGRPPRLIATDHGSGVGRRPGLSTWPPRHRHGACTAAGLPGADWLCPATARRSPASYCEAHG